MISNTQSTVRRMIAARRKAAGAAEVDKPLHMSGDLNFDVQGFSCDSTDEPPARRLRTEPTKQYPTGKGALRTNFRNYHDMAVILVGHQEAKYTLHKDLLASVSPFFAAALNGHFTESESQTVRLPEERADIFEWFVQWLYTSSLTSTADTCLSSSQADTNYTKKSSQAETKWTEKPTHTDGDLRNSAGSPKYFLLIDIYALSDRLLTTSLSNHIINLVARLSEETNSVPTPSDTWLLYGDCASFSGLHHCACRTAHSIPRSSPSGPPAPCPSMTSRTISATGPSTGPNLGVRPTAPLRDLILDLFAYKKTDRLLASHRDDWHPLFLRDLVGRLKRPGRDALARHGAGLRPWLPAAWDDSRACAVCRKVVGPDGVVGRGARPAAARAAISGAAVVVGDGGAVAEGARPEQPLRCAGCDAVFCERCLAKALGGGLEAGDAGWALMGEVGSCKPWLGWDEAVLQGGKKGRKGVCGRYHEHGPLA